MIGRTIGNYRITELLGQGGMGEVYLGTHPLIGKRVAIKVLLDELSAREDIVARFFNEAKAVNDIGHENIVDVVDFGRSTNDRGREVVYFIMEYLDGENLAHRIRRQSPTTDESRYILGQCCSALAASHEKGIVHRDLKPENIYLTARGTDPSFVKLLDFGIAKLSGQSATPSSRTRTGTVFGTPQYMSPEQCAGTGQIDHRSDVYSLGVVMYEMLTGQVPFSAEGFGELMMLHMTRQPTPPSALRPGLWPALEAIALRALEKDRGRRFQDMREFAAALADPEAHHRRGSSAAPIGSFSSPTRPDTDDSEPRGPQPAALRAPHPTTLSGAAVEMRTRTQRRRRLPVVALLLLAIALLGAGGFVVALRGGMSLQPAVVLSSPAEPIAIRVTSDPPGAVVRRPEGELGLTPLVISAKRGDPPFELQLRLAGFDSARREVVVDRDQDIVVHLVPTPTSPTSTPTTTPTTPTAPTTTPTTTPPAALSPPTTSPIEVATRASARSPAGAAPSRAVHHRARSKAQPAEPSEAEAQILKDPDLDILQPQF